MTAYEVGYWLGEAAVVGAVWTGVIVGLLACLPPVRRGVREGWIKSRDVRQDVQVQDRFTWDGTTRIEITKEPDDQ